jgi:hypothetical protein
MGDYYYKETLSIKKGNLKLDKTVGIFCLPTKITCTNYTSCNKKCYARQAEIQYKAVLPARMNNYNYSKSDKFVEEMIGLIKRSKAKIFRIHESGDFYSKEYSNKWIKIIRALPKVQFYTYTKSPYAPKIRLKNLNIVKSILPDGEINFGSKEYIETKVNKFGFPVCPYSKKNKIKCGKDCNICLNHEYVLFHKH